MNTMKFAKKLAIPLFVALAYVPSQGFAQSILGAGATDLGSFAVLGGGSVTNVPTAGTVITGNLGNTADSTTGFFLTDGGNGLVNGTIYGAGAITTTAETQLTAAMGVLSGYGVGTTVAGGDLLAYQALHGGYITPGVYTLGASLLNGAIHLNGLGNANALWVFQTSALTTSTTSTVDVIGTGSGAGIYWNVSSAATLNGSTFAGNVLANALISTDGDLTIDCGRLLSGTAVTFANDMGGSHISTGCAGIGLGSGGFDQAHVVSAIPEPETYAMLLSGLGLMGFVARRRQRNLAAAA